MAVHRQSALVTSRGGAIAGLVLLAALISVLLVAPHSTAAGALETAQNNSSDTGTSLVAPGSLARHPEAAELLRETTRGSTVARGDLAVARFRVPDLDDYFDDTRPRSELDVDGLSLKVTHVGSNRAGTAPAWRDDATNVTVVPAPDDGALYALWLVPQDADRGSYEVTLTERGNASSGNRSVRVPFTVVERDVDFGVGETAIFQPTTTVILGNTTVAPGTYLTLQGLAPGETGFPVNETVVVRGDRSFTARMDYSSTTNGTAFTLVALGYPDSAVPGRIVGPAPPTPTTTTAAGPSSTTTAATTRTTTAPITSDSTTTKTGGQPGFGLLGAMLAVVAALVIASRTGFS